MSASSGTHVRIQLSYLKRLPVTHGLDFSLMPFVTFATMATLDFANMNKHDLLTFRRKAIKARERPSAQNNYLSMTFSADVMNKQPADYILTKLYSTWCEHHGPSNHATAECCSVNDPHAKPVSALKAEPAHGRRMNRVKKEVVMPLLTTDD